MTLLPVPVFRKIWRARLAYPSAMPDSRIPNLKRLRTERLLTQAQLAAALSIAPRTILRWEAGDGEPGVSELQTMARFFRMSVDQLLSELVATPTADAVIRVATLEGRALDHWVARAEGLPAQMVDGEPVWYEHGVGQHRVPAYSTDGAAGLEIIEAWRVHMQPIGLGKFDGVKLEGRGWLARCEESPHTMHGSTFLVAAMRAAVAAAMGLELIG
jgi:transcriptional regulator with XRE-family HTH domain